MARQGFFEIRTFETLSRDFMVNQVGYDTIVKKSSEQDDGEAPEHARKKDSVLNKRTQKQRDKQMLVTAPKTDSRGHTGYLTFAIKF